MAGVVIVHFVRTLVAGYSNFVSVQNDEITGIHVPGVFRFVLPRRRRASSVTERPRSFTGRVSNIPVARFTVSGCKSFH